MKATIVGNIPRVRLTQELLLVGILLLTLNLTGFGQQVSCIYYASSLLSGTQTTITPAQLQNLLTAHPTCQIVVDVGVNQFMATDIPLKIPRRTTLKGMGPQGLVTLDFSQITGSGNAITIDSPIGQDYVVIENLAIAGSPTPTALYGINLTNAGIIYLRNLVIRNFNIGVYGNNSFSVFADNCNVSSNYTDSYQLNMSSNSWRLRGGLCSQAGLGGSGYGININSANNTVIEGVRMESNTSGAIRTAGTCRACAGAVSGRTMPAR